MQAAPRPLEAHFGVPPQAVLVPQGNLPPQAIVPPQAGLPPQAVLEPPKVLSPQSGLAPQATNILQLDQRGQGVPNLIQPGVLQSPLPTPGIPLSTAPVLPLSGNMPITSTVPTTGI
jgi:hypothetical protein